MKSRSILSRNISTLLLMTALGGVSSAADVIWDGAGISDTNLGNALNWNTDALPSVVNGDNAIWNGTVTGPLSLIYSDAAFAGGPGNPGINLVVATGQTGSLNLDSGLNTGSFRMNGLSIAAGTGAFSLGNGTDVFNVTIGGAGGQVHTWTNDSTNTATVGADVAFGLGGGGAHTLALGGSGNWLFNNAIGQGAGVLTLTKSGTGTLNLVGASTYTGGLILNSGTVLINNASSLGNTATGNLTINGGTIDNTSGAAIMLTAAKASNWNGDFTFTGTNSLDLRGGSVTIAGATGQRTVNVVNGTLSTGLINAAAGYGLTKTGAGTLAMTSTTNTSNIAGTLDVQQGKLQVAGDFTVGGLTGSGIIENGGTAAKWFFVNNAADSTFSGTIQNGASARLGFVKRGTGTLHLTGANNTFSDNFAIENGTIRITGINSTGHSAGGQASVGTIANQSGVLIVDGGTLNATKPTAPSLALGTVANSRGFIQVNSGTINATSEIRLGLGAGSFSALSMSGGTVNSGNWFVVGLNNDRAIINQSGGAINVATSPMTIAAGGTGSLSVVNLSGGTMTATAGGILVGERGAATLNISGTANVSVANNGLTIGPAASQTGWSGALNIFGGTVTTNKIAKGLGTGNAILTLNGALIKAATNNTTFLQGLNSAHLYSGGVTFDSNGSNITVAQPLLTPTGSGLSSIAVATGGAGYLDTPIVTITGGSGTGASAVAQVSGGVVTGFTITNPGNGYLPTDALTITLTGGGATTAATTGTTGFVTNVSGGLTKVGNGTLSLTGASSFTGNVLVTAGTLEAGFTNIGNPTTSALGNATVAGRTVTVNPGATLRLTANDALGNQTAVPANLPTLLVNGTLSTTRYNQIGAVTLNGATLSSSNTTDSGNYQNFQFLADVNVIGSAPSFISATGNPNFDANHLSGSTTFNVADVTGNASADLIVSAPFRNQSGNYGLGAGSLVKAGAGRMELTGISSYSGSTTINGGVLAVSASGSINASTGIAVNGGGRLIQASSISMTPVVSINDGSLDGVGTIDVVNVADLATNTIVAGDILPGTPLMIGALTFTGSGRVSVTSNSTSAPLIANSLTTNGGTITVNATNASWTNGNYELISYGGLTGSGFAPFIKGTITGLGARQNATLGDSGSAVILTIAGDFPVWTGRQSGSWSTAVIPSLKNWKLQSAGTATDYITNDTVLFDDTALGTTTVSIDGGNVSPASVTFGNNSKTYTITSTGGAGIATGSLTKTGTGTLILGGNHTYTGPTLLNAGMTDITGSLGNTPVTVASGASLSLSAVNAITQNTLTVDGTFSQSVNNAIGGTASVVLNNGAFLTSGNAHSGGTRLNAGLLRLNHPTSIGTGVLSIFGGSIDNTTGNPITLTNNNNQVWASGAFLDFVGTSALNMGTGTVSLGTDASTGTFTIVNSSGLSGTSLTVGGAITAGTGGAAGVKTLVLEGQGQTTLSGNLTAGSATSLVVTDNAPGTLTLSGAASTINTLNVNGGSSSSINLGTGHLTLANGGGNILQSTTGGTINATGGGGIILGSNNGDFGTAGNTTLTVNAPISGANTVDFYNANGGGLGTIILTAANTYTGGTNVQNTRLVLPAGSAINAGNVANVGQFTVGDINGSPGILDLNGGTINATKTASPSFAVGSVANAIGVVNHTAGTVNTTSEFHLGRGAGGYAAYNLSGGAVNSGNWMAVGFNNDNAILNQSGGAITVVTNRLTIGAGGANAKGVVNQSGGTFTVNAGANTGVFVGENGNGVYNLSGNAELTLNTNGGATSGTLQFAGNATSTSGQFNLNGGTATVFGVTKGASAVGGSYRFNFNGGTLKANGANTAFFSALADTTAYVNAGGAVIDDGGFAITVAQPLLAPTGSGVGTITASGSGYVGTPLVQITGDGVGATAVANIDANGNITGVTITNPGVGYTTASATLVGGGSFGFVENMTLAANASGGLTKKGNGTLTLAGLNTYTGPTVIESGTLALTGSISASTVINVKAGATLNVTGLPGFNVAAGQTLQGNGFVNGATALGLGASLAPGQSVGTLTFTNALDLTGAITPTGTGALKFELGAVGASDLAVVNGGLTIGTGFLGFDDFNFTTVAGFGAGVFTLFDGTTAIAGSFDGAHLSGSLGGPFTGTLSFADDGKDIVLTVVPEPGSAMLLLGGIALMAAGRRRRRA